MCGLAGFSLSTRDSRWVDTSQLSEALLGGIELRGPHATGVAWVDGGVVRHRKAPIRASSFIEQYGSIPKQATNALLHARYATQGDPADSRNNHPIRVQPVTGVHNGVIFNATELYDRTPHTERLHGVDSEAIFALLAHTREHPTEALEQLEGSATVAWYDDRDPSIVQVARGATSPLITARTDGGSFLFASTESALTEAADHTSLTLRDICTQNEGVHLSVRAGQVVHQCTFEADRPRGALDELERLALNFS